MAFKLKSYVGMSVVLKAGTYEKFAPLSFPAYRSLFPVLTHLLNEREILFGQCNPHVYVDRGASSPSTMVGCKIISI